MSVEGHENIAYRPRQATTVFCQEKEKGRKGKGNAHLHYAMRYSTCKSVIRQLHIAVYRDRFNPLIFQMLNHEIIFAKISSECNKQFGHYTNSATLNGNCYSLIFHLSTRIEEPLWSDFLFVNLWLGLIR